MKSLIKLRKNKEPIKEETTIMAWIKKLEVEKIHFCLRNESEKRIFSEMEVNIILFLLDKRKNTTSDQLGRDLKLVSTNCIVRSSPEVLSVEKIQLLNKEEEEKQIRQQKMIKGREADLLFWIYRIIDEANLEFDKRNSSWWKFFLFKLDRRTYIKKFIIKKLKRSILFNHEPL